MVLPVRLIGFWFSHQFIIYIYQRVFFGKFYINCSNSYFWTAETSSQCSFSSSLKKRKKRRLYCTSSTIAISLSSPRRSHTCKTSLTNSWCDTLPQNDALWFFFFRTVTLLSQLPVLDDVMHLFFVTSDLTLDNRRTPCFSHFSSFCAVIATMVPGQGRCTAPTEVSN